MTVTFFVPGKPAQQGSKRFAGVHNGRGIMLDTNPNLKSWRGCVSQACPMEAPLNCAVALDLVFRFSRPKSHYGRKNKEPYLKDDAPYYKTSAPDCDKLARAILDALTGVAYIDDAQVCKLSAAKVYTEGAEGVEITVRMVGCPEHPSHPAYAEDKPLGVA